MMIPRSTLLLLSAISFGVHADTWEFSYRPAMTGYALYGNSMGDPTRPSEGDRKIAFEIKGQAARAMFEAMGPDRKDLCLDATDSRFRSRDDDRIVCTRSERGKYACYFGFDLETGKSIGGSIC